MADPWAKFIPNTPTSDTAAPEAQDPWAKFVTQKGGPSSGGGASPSPPATVASQTAGGTTLGSVARRVAGAVPRLLDYPSTYKAEVQGNIDLMKKGAQDIKDRKKTLGVPYLAGAAEEALGAAGYAYSPIAAGVNVLAGAPVERVTGNKKAGELADFIGNIMIPGPGAVDAAMDTAAGRVSRKVFAPETVDANAREADALARSTYGPAAQDTAKSVAALDAHTKVVRGMDDLQRRDLIKYVESASKNPKPLPEPQMKLANTLRDIYQSVRKQLEGLDKFQKMRFIDDYFAHQYKNIFGVENTPGIPGVGKEGSGAFTKERSIPTIEDSIEKGHTPNLDPIEVTARYVANANKFIATEKFINEGRRLKSVRYFSPGKQPEGWVELGGRVSQNGLRKAYAPEGWARVYNNYISQGFKGEAKSIYDTMQHANNALTMAAFGLSAYHARTMAKEAFANEVARATNQLRHGEFGEAIKTGAKAPAAFATLPYKGAKFKNAYLGLNKGSDEMNRLVDLFTKAGGRLGGSQYTGGEYLFTGKSTFQRAFQRGTLKSELAADLGEIKNSPLAGSVKVLGRNIGRTMQSVVAKLFDSYIPSLKRGAWAENMSDWLRRNPSATHEQQVAQATYQWKLIESRMGEMDKNLIMWHQKFKQIAQLAMKSFSWEMGTAQTLGGGLTDIAKRKWTPKVDYLVALVVGDAISNTAYQLAKTGQWPQDVADLIAPKTGGKNPDGTPERAGVVGYMKDLYGWLNDPRQEARNKASFGSGLVSDLVTGKDWRDLPIAPPDDPKATKLANTSKAIGYYLDHVADQFLPISAQNYLKKNKKSNISSLEKFLGTSPAGQQYTNPKHAEDARLKHERKAWATKQYEDQVQKARYGGIN